jgi:NADPH2:quinone reductase
MERIGQTPGHGPVVVTGATGGVGSIAIDMLSALGYEVIAFTGKQDQYDYLRELGASDFIDRHSVEMGTRPLEKAQWGGAVDNVGGDTLAWLTRTVKPYGNIAAIGLAGGIKLETTVLPFILRGVSLLGINSLEMPLALRDEAWERLAGDLRPRHLDRIARHELSLAELPTAFDGYIRSEVVGRTIVRIEA